MNASRREWVSNRTLRCAAFGDRAVRIGDKLSRGAEVSIVLLAPLIGG
jgi:hypothetical protein